MQLLRLGLLLAVATLVLPIAATLRPHILVLVLDDWGFANLGANRNDPAGQREVVTPNLDAILAGGRHLTQAYVHKFCSPSRSALQSGRLPLHVNVLNLRRGAQRQRPRVGLCGRAAQHDGHRLEDGGGWLRDAHGW